MKNYQVFRFQNFPTSLFHGFHDLNIPTKNKGKMSRKERKRRKEDKERL